MGRLEILAACLLLAAGAGAAVNPTNTTYTTECHTYGTWDRTNPTSMPMLTATPKLALPGLTLAQLSATSTLGTPYALLSFLCGGWVGDKVPVYEQPGKSFSFSSLDGNTNFVVKGFARYVDGHTKVVIAKLTDGDGGICAQTLASRVSMDVNTPNATYFKVNETTGAITYQGGGSTLAQTYNANGYGLCGLVAAPFIPTQATTVWSNPLGEAVLTLDDIAEHRITARMAGPSVGLASEIAAEYNRYEVRDSSGRLTLIRLEMQILDDKYVKCVVLELTNAADGVAARVVKGAYKATASGGYVGMAFIKDHATYAANANSKSSYDATNIYPPATSFTSGNYGLYALTATPQPAVELVLDRSKTWTELVDGLDLSDPSVTLNLRVPAADAVLTFDQAIGFDRLVVFPAAEQANVFRVAPGLEPANVQFGQITVKANHRLTLPPSLGATAIEVAAGSTLVFTGGVETAATVTSAISGGGGVEVAAGKVKFTNGASTYMGGTVVKRGATAIPGAAAVNAGFALWTGVFGTVASANLVTIEEGGLVDLAGQSGAGGYYALAGTNRIVNTGADTGTSLGLSGFALADDAALSFVDSPFHFNSNVAVTYALGTNTFTKLGTNTVLFAAGETGVTLTGTGTFDVAEGGVEISHGNFVGASAALNVASNATLRVAGSKVEFKTARVDGLVEFQGTGFGYLLGTVSGAGTVRKIGTEWTAYVKVNNGSRLNYEVTGGVMAVSDRILAPNDQYYAFNEPGQPRVNCAVTVGGTGSFDFNGVQSFTPCCTIAGKGYRGTRGALCNIGADLPLNRQQIVQLTLAGDAQVGGTADKGSFGLLAPGYKPTRLELGEHTLTVFKTNRFYLVNTTITGTGKIFVEKGSLYLYRASAGDAYTLEIGTNGVLTLDAPLTAGSFANRGTVGGTAALTVKGTVFTTTNAIPRLALANGANVKVTDGRTPLTVSDALTLNGTVTVDAEGIVPGEDGLGDAVSLFDVPAGTVTSGVKIEVVNLEPGVSASFSKGFPVLTRSGLCVFIR